MPSNANQARVLIEHVAEAMWIESERLRRLAAPVAIVPWFQAPEHIKHAFRCMVSAGLRSINIDHGNARIDPDANVNAMAGIKPAGTA